MNPFNITWNPNCIRRNTIIQIVIVSLAFFLLIRVWPCNLVKSHSTSKQQAVRNYKELSGETFTSADKKLQTVKFTENHIGSITLYLSCTSYQAGDKVLFRLYDEGFSCIYEEEYACSKIEKNYAMKVTPDLDVDTAADYYYEVLIPEEESTVLNLAVADNSLLSQQENGPLYIDGIINESSSLIADFEYTQKLSVFAVILYDILILAFSAACYFGILYLLERFEEYLPELLRYGRWIATGFGGMFAIVVFILAVLRNSFGGEIADRVVYTLGILAGTAWYMYALWIPKDRRKPSRLTQERQISLIWRNYIQTIVFGFLFYALCMYVNADREYFHYTNTRWMLIFLGIAFLMIHSEKELMNIPSYVWTGVSVIGAIFYCHGYTDDSELYLAKLTAAVVVVWGLVVINAILQCKKQAWKAVHKPFAVIWLVFGILMIIFRYQKTWPFTATLPFAVLLLYNLSAAQKSRLLKNLANGIIVSFGFVVLFSLHHRPYHYWMRYRYNMVFHTVASTGMYLSTVFAALVAKIYGKWKDKEFKWNRCAGELFVLAAVVSFVLFTMSRTALLTMSVTFILVVLLRQWVYRINVKQVFMEFGIIIMAVGLSFPFMYSTLRMVPAVADDPVRYDLEPQDSSYMIYEGDPVDSDKYMNIERFFNLFFNRLDMGQAKGLEIQENNTESELLAYAGNTYLPVATGTSGDKYVLESNSDVSNGRFEIFLAYLQRLNITGHDKMTAEGTDYGHAHNSYIQVAYDFGSIAGVVFLILCAYTLIQSVLLFKKHGEKYGTFIIPFAFIVNFGFMSVTEWAFHPCIPAGFCFLFVQMLLMQEGRNNKG